MAALGYVYYCYPLSIAFLSMQASLSGAFPLPNVLSTIPRRFSFASTFSKTSNVIPGKNGSHATFESNLALRLSG